MPDGGTPEAATRGVLGSRCTGFSWLDFRSTSDVAAIVAGAEAAGEPTAPVPSFRCFGVRAPVLAGPTEAGTLEETIGIYGCVGSLEYFDGEPYLARCSGLSVEVLRRPRSDDTREASQQSPLWNLWQQAEEFAARGPEAIPVVARAVGDRLHDIGDKTVLVGKAAAQQDFPQRTQDRAFEICNTARRILTRVRTAVDVRSWASESEGS
jgi:hypothetical protein